MNKTEAAGYDHVSGGYSLNAKVEDRRTGKTEKVKHYLRKLAERLDMRVGTGKVSNKEKTVWLYRLYKEGGLTKVNSEIENLFEATREREEQRYSRGEYLDFMGEAEAKKLSRYKVKKRLKLIAEDNEKRGVKFITDTYYWCETCKSEDGKCDPETGYCYHCRTDNWRRKD